MKRELRYNNGEVISVIHSTLQQAFEENNGIVTIDMAKKYGIHDSTLRKAVERNDIQRVRRGIYLLDDLSFDDLYILQLQYSKAVFSHETAVMLHWLSTNYPFVYHVSLPRGYHLENAKEQKIKPYYVQKEELADEYVQTIDSWDSNPIQVTNLEKTVIDMLKCDDCMPDVIDEMIEDYIRRENKNLNRLLKYGQRFGVLQILEERGVLQ